MSIIYRRSIDRDTGEEHQFGGASWYHEDDRDDFDAEAPYGRWGEGRRPCRPHYQASGHPGDIVGMPKTICMELKQDDQVCGRKIPRDNLDENIYACGTHAKFERSRLAAQEATRLRQMKDAEETDLRSWARKSLGSKVATIIESGLAVKWNSGEPNSNRYRESDPDMHVTVLIEDLLDYMEKHHD